MAAVVWPTHKAKERERQTHKLALKKRSRKIRRLLKDGKRGDLSV